MEVQNNVKVNYNANTMKSLYGFDNIIGYRYGMFMWLSFWIPSLIVLFADSTVGASRDCLFLVSLFSSLTFAYYSYHRWLGTPASTPAMHALSAESTARWIVYAYYGISAVTGSHAIGVINWIQIIASALFGLSKFAGLIYVNFFADEYKSYEQDQREHVV